jgi:SAM-dependent methyltransferase
MGDDVHQPATAEQIAAMVALLHESLRSGALGLSSSLGDAHTDGDGNPVPSRAAQPDEFLALARAVRDHAGTSLEFIPGMGEISDERIALMTDMSLAADRPLNWNLLGSFSATEVYEQQLSATDHARARGAEVVGVDPSIGMLSVARRVRPEVPVVGAEGLDLPFRDGSFDIVAGSFVLAHFRRPETAIFDLIRVLRPGGRLAFSTWADGPDAFTDTWRELIDGVVPKELLAPSIARAIPTHDRFRRREPLELLLHDAGLGHVRSEPMTYEWHYGRDEFVDGLQAWATARFARGVGRVHGTRTHDVRRTVPRPPPRPPRRAAGRRHEAVARLLLRPVRGFGGRAPRSPRPRARVRRTTTATGSGIRRSRRRGPCASTPSPDRGAGRTRRTAGPPRSPRPRRTTSAAGSAA